MWNRRIFDLGRICTASFVQNRCRSLKISFWGQKTSGRLNFSQQNLYLSLESKVVGFFSVRASVPENGTQRQNRPSFRTGPIDHVFRKSPDRGTVRFPEPTRFPDENSNSSIKNNERSEIKKFVCHYISVVFMFRCLNQNLPRHARSQSPLAINF